MHQDCTELDIVYFSSGGNERGVTLRPKLDMHVLDSAGNAFQDNPSVQQGDFLKFEIELDTSDGKKLLSLYMT